jgi:TolB-like protein/Tfp pilus assembly protein PilF
MNTPVMIYEFGAFSLNASEHLLIRDGQVVALKPKVLDLLLILVQNSGHIVEKEVLMKQIWPDSFVEESNLAVNISVLRKVLGKGKDGKAYIENISKRGYRFVAEVIVAEPAPHQFTIQTNGKYPAHSGRTSIAVLPFKHIGSSENDEYLGLGITDALITRLSNVQQVIIRPTNAVRKYQDVLDPIAVGQELKVETVLDGSIRQSGQRIRVTVQLVSVADGVSLWAEKFDEQFTGIFEVEDSISEQVTKALMLRLSSEEKERLVKHHTDDSEAYQAYLRGRYYSDKRIPDTLNKAIGYFQQAIDIDPNYALAYCGLAQSYIFASGYNLLSPKEYLPKAEEAILKALQIDDTLAEAHGTLGYYKLFIWDWSGAEKELRRAIEQNPNSTLHRRWYAIYLRQMACLDAAKVEIQKALELDPLSINLLANLAITLFFARQYDQAIEYLSETLELEPLAGTRLLLGLAYEQKNMHDKAIIEFKKAMNDQVMKSETLAYIGYSYATSGRKAKAQKVLDELLEISQKEYVEPYFIALIYTALGERDEAFAWLEKGYEEHILTMGELKIDPMFDSLRNDPRFDNLLQRMGLADTINCG